MGGTVLEMVALTWMCFLCGLEGSRDLALLVSASVRTGEMSRDTSSVISMERKCGGESCSVLPSSVCLCNLRWGSWWGFPVVVLPLPGLLHCPSPSACTGCYCPLSYGCKCPSGEALKSSRGSGFAMVPVQISSRFSALLRPF